VKLIIEESFNKLGANNVSHFLASGHLDITKKSTRTGPSDITKKKRIEEEVLFVGFYYEWN
jgi:hypothetical protein